MPVAPGRRSARDISTLIKSSGASKPEAKQESGSARNLVAARRIMSRSILDKPFFPVHVFRNGV
jgi:hypothetical protein